MIVAEIIFRQISAQVLLSAVLINAFHTPLEDREITFSRVGVYVAANVLFMRMRNGFVSGKGLATFL